MLIVDQPNDIHATRLRELLDSMGLRQHIQIPTHVHGHTSTLQSANFHSVIFQSVIVLQSCKVSYSVWVAGKTV